MCAGPLLTFLLILPLQSNTGGKILWSFLSEPSQSLAILVTNPLIHCCLVDLVDVILACEDANSKLVEAVTVADAEDHAGNSFLIGFLIRELTFGHKAKLLFRL